MSGALVITGLGLVLPCGDGPEAARASLAAGLIALAAGEIDAARRDLEDAVDRFDQSGAPFEAACARVDLAGALARRQGPARDAAQQVIDHPVGHLLNRNLAGGQPRLDRFRPGG